MSVDDIGGSLNRFESGSAASIWMACSLVVFLLYFGGGISSAALGLLWLGQGSLGSHFLSAVIDRRLGFDRQLLQVGPGYLVGYLITTWLFMTLGGGPMAKTVVYACLTAAVVTDLLRRRITLRWSFADVPQRMVLFSLILMAMSWEFPQLLIPAVALLCTAALVVAERISWKSKLDLVAVCLLVFLFGVFLRSKYWFLESDDLPNRMAEGIVTVVRGRVASVGAYPFDRYHWVSPVGTALQAELTGANLMFVFTVFSVIASLAMMIASFGLLLRSIRSGANQSLVLLLSGTTLFLWWKVQIDTEAAVGRLAILLVLVSIARLLQQSLQTSTRRLAGAVTTIAFVLLLCAMLYLYRPDLVVFILLLALGVVVSLVRISHRFKMVLLGLSTIIALITGLFAMSVILSEVSGSNLSYAQLLVDWRPPDLGWCTRGSTLRDVMCVISLDADLWAAGVIVVALIVVSTKQHDPLSDLMVLLFPAIPSFFAFRLSLTSDFPSAIEGFLQIGLLSTRVLVIVFAVYVLSRMGSRRAWLSVVGAGVFAFVHVNLRTRIGSMLEQRQEGISGRLQGIFTPFLLQWLLASAVLVLVLAVAHRVIVRHLSISHAVFLGFIAIGIWNLHLTRPLTSDVDEVLIANVVGPDDVFEVGHWLRENTSASAILATNYQCRPEELERCRSLTQVGDGHPRATANWMLMAESRREFLYLSQPFYNLPEFRALHDVSIAPGTQVDPRFESLKERGVDYFVACRVCSSPEAWRQLKDRAMFSTSNFAVVKVD